MLTAKRGNPNVVGRNRSSGSLEFGSKSCIGDGRLLIDIKHPVIANRLRQPLLVALAVTGLPDSIPVFAQHNDGDGDLRGVTEVRFEFAVPICDG